MNKIAQIFGNVNAPPGVDAYGATGGSGLPTFFASIIKLLIVVAGLYALFNFIFAGYAFLSAGGDSKKIAEAWAKIWQSMLGVIITAGAFILAALVSRFVFNDYTTIFQFRVFGP